MFLMANPTAKFLASMKTSLLLASVCLAEQRYPEAEQHARQVIRSDPLREPAWQIVIQALRHMGRRAEAIESHQQLVEQLHTELGIAPSPAYGSSD